MEVDWPPCQNEGRLTDVSCVDDSYLAVPTHSYTLVVEL